MALRTEALSSRTSAATTHSAARNSATWCSYVRSGDFGRELLLENQDVDEYAFALGALSHYAADIAGHQEAVNLSVAIEYPMSFLSTLT
jgi:hypothetical protein